MSGALKKSKLLKSPHVVPLHDVTDKYSASSRPSFLSKYKSFALVVVAPFLFVVVYLWGLSQNQYVSRVGFVIQKNKNSEHVGFDNSIAQLFGSNSTDNSALVRDYILSQSMVDALQEQIDLRKQFSVFWKKDPLFHLWPYASKEWIHWFWSRRVRVQHDPRTGIMWVKVQDSDPRFAFELTDQILHESQAMISSLNQKSQAHILFVAQENLAKSKTRLSAIRDELSGFRRDAKIVSPELEIEAQISALSVLLPMSVSTKSELEHLRLTAGEDDPRVENLKRKSEVLEQQISDVKSRISLSTVENTNADLPSLISRYETIITDLNFAEEQYVSAQSVYEAAQLSALENSLFITVFAPASVAESATFPNRPKILSITFVFLLLSWILFFHTRRARNNQ